MTNKYYELLGKILENGAGQENKKGRIRYLTNEQMVLKPADLLEIFETYGVARNKLKRELALFEKGRARRHSTGRPASAGGTTVGSGW